MDPASAVGGLNPDYPAVYNLLYDRLKGLCLIPFFFLMPRNILNCWPSLKICGYFERKKLRKKLSCPWMRGEEDWLSHWCFGVSEQGNWEKDRGISLSLCFQN